LSKLEGWTCPPPKGKGNGRVWSRFEKRGASPIWERRAEGDNLTTTTERGPQGKVHKKKNKNTRKKRDRERGGV